MGLRTRLQPELQCLVYFWLLHLFIWQKEGQILYICHFACCIIISFLLRRARNAAVFPGSNSGSLHFSTGSIEGGQYAAHRMKLFSFFPSFIFSPTHSLSSISLHPCVSLFLPELSFSSSLSVCLSAVVNYITMAQQLAVLHVVIEDIHHTPVFYEYECEMVGLKVNVLTFSNYISILQRKHYNPKEMFLSLSAFQVILNKE